MWNIKNADERNEASSKTAAAIAAAFADFYVLKSIWIKDGFLICRNFPHLLMMPWERRIFSVMSSYYKMLLHSARIFFKTFHDSKMVKIRIRSYGLFLLGLFWKPKWWPTWKMVRKVPILSFRAVEIRLVRLICLVTNFQTSIESLKL